MTEHFRHRLLQALLAAKLISQRKVTELLGWKHSGFHIDSGGEAPVAPHDTDGRRRLAEYLLLAPFSLQKMTWNPDIKTVIYRSRRSWHTKRNFEVFKATDFLAAAIEHIPPKGQQTIRYYGLYSNKTRGLAKPTPEIIPPSCEQSAKPQETNFIIHHSTFLRPAPCAHSGGTSSSASGAPIPSSARAAKPPCAEPKPSSARKKLNSTSASTASGKPSSAH